MRFVGKLIKYNKIFLWFDVGHGRIRRIPLKNLQINGVLPVDENELLTTLMEMQITNTINEVKKE